MKCENVYSNDSMVVATGGVAQWVARDRWIPVSRVFEPRCFLEQETLL